MAGLPGVPGPSRAPLTPLPDSVFLSFDGCRNGGCWFFNTDSCLTGWPLHPGPPGAVRLYYNAEAGWYLHLLLKPVFR
jgi:hypothetical protein